MNDEPMNKGQNTPSEEGTVIDPASSLRAVLNWYRDMGVDISIGSEPVNAFEWDEHTGAETQQLSRQPATQDRHSPQHRPARQTTEPSRPVTNILRPDTSAPSPDEAISAARERAAACTTLTELTNAVASFDGCPLKKGARSTVFGVGVEHAPLLVLGEAPGRDEDRDGKPFVGKAGQLLDKMLGAIDHSRETNTYISNVIFWRPPGNRTPTDTEMHICKPFTERLIEIMQPKVILLAGGAPLKAMMEKTGIMRMRGKWQSLSTSKGAIPTLPTFHPAYLLRNPQAKRLVWEDLQSLRDKLHHSAAGNES